MPDTATPRTIDPHDDTGPDHVWLALTGDADASTTPRLQFLVLGNSGDVLSLLEGTGSGWSAAGTLSGTAYGDLQVFNGKDLNNQAYQVLVSQPVTVPSVMG
ncbi:hypothetical protein [Leptothrix discophora]|uniref:Uncharacterized protein n=1 Tax=Leptothrix discophora TaxID=89 RepID=A0ABT9G1Y6_LEPDI|nr:hypothetical protein [Leptothrix discophora]MDP4300496.1 hypothetical protein [Leptothrix discophora]